MTKSLIYRSQRDFSNIVQVFFWRVYFSWRARRASVTLKERILATFSHDFRESLTLPDSQRLTVAGLASRRMASSFWEMASLLRSAFSVVLLILMRQRKIFPCFFSSMSGLFWYSIKSAFSRLWMSNRICFIDFYTNQGRKSFNDDFLNGSHCRAL